MRFKWWPTVLLEWDSSLQLLTNSCSVIEKRLFSQILQIFNFSQLLFCWWIGKKAILIQITTHPRYYNRSSIRNKSSFSYIRFAFRNFLVNAKKTLSSFEDEITVATCLEYLLMLESVLTFIKPNQQSVS